MSCSRAKSPHNHRSTCMCMFVGPNLQICGQCVIYTRSIQLKSDEIFSIRHGLISTQHQQDYTEARRWRQNHFLEKIHSKLLPAADTLAACNLTLLKSRLQTNT